MPNHRDVEWLLGRRFVCDFRVVAISGGRPDVADDPERTVTIYMYGEQCRLSFGELQTLIETGFVVEAGGEK